MRRVLSVRLLKIAHGLFKKLIVVLYLIVFLVAHPADASEGLRLIVLDKPSDGIKRVYVSHSQPNQRPIAVVVLADVYNRSERPVLQGAARTSFDQMVDDVQSNQLGFVHFEINEDGSLASRMDKKKVLLVILS